MMDTTNPTGKSHCVSGDVGPTFLLDARYAVPGPVYNMDEDGQMCFLDTETCGDAVDVGIIELWPFEAICGICTKEITIPRTGGKALPMYEGRVVDPSVTKEWAGFYVCDGCWEEHQVDIHD